MGTAEENNKNAPIAFVLVIAAGLSTCLGAAFVFNTRLVKLASKRFLAGSLGVAAGVMLYVSFVEIFVKSQIAFSAHGYSDADAYLYATVSLFGGMLFYKGIDYLVHCIEGDVGDHNVDIDLYDLDGSSSSGSPRTKGTAGGSETTKGSRSPGVLKGAPDGTIAVTPSRSTKAGGATAASNGRSAGSYPHEHDVVVELSSGHAAVRPSPDLHTLQLRMAGKVQQPYLSSAAALTPEHKSSDDELAAVEQGDGEGTVSAGAEGGGGGGLDIVVDEDKEKLVRMGLMTAVAIGIHNFPEGLATFVAALSDPSVGLALAVAIGIHNVPEGLCVAIPVYYATGNRWKAFGWALLSGVSEPIGAGLGWLVLKDIMSELVYGILFGTVAGMMINITLHELIPTAVRYDPADKVTTNSIIAGMVIMSISLVLFLY